MNIHYFHDHEYSLKPKILRKTKIASNIKKLNIYFQNQNSCELYSRIKNTSIYNMSDIDFQTQLFTLVHDVAGLNFLSLTFNFMQKRLAF